MREGQPARPAGGEAAEGVQRQVEVEVGRRGRRAQHAHLGQAHSDGVAHEQQAALAVVQGKVVLGVAGRVDAGQRAPGPDRDLLAVGQHANPIGGCGRQAAVEAVQQLAVDHRRRPHQPFRIHQMPGALLVHVHGRFRERGGDVAHATGVVEVDVGDDDAGQVIGGHAEVGQLGQHGGERALTAGLDEARLGALDQVARRHLTPSTQPGVDLDHARSQHACSSRAVLPHRARPTHCRLRDHRP